MPTASTTSAKPTRAKAARKTARAKAAGRARAASATNQSRTTSAKAAPGEAGIRQAQTATRDTAAAVGDYAERAVLIPVGAALIARDRVVSTVSDTLSTYSSSAKTQ
ncbi:MAG TPA: hypothetical protein VJ996_07325, partial [Solirubrobacteraceae bacterium]|nr:hypothetical protein [Solirubrobacteraceae bacterium]